MIKFIALMQKELILARRHSHMMLSLFLFSTLVILISYFGLDALGERPQEIVPSIIWIAVIFGGTLQLNRTFDFEREEDVLAGIALIPGTAMPFFLTKLITNLAVVLALFLYSSFIAAVVFNYPLIANMGHICLPFILGILGMCAVGTTFSTMVMTHHKRDVLLPTIFYPLTLPLSIAVIKSFGDDVQMKSSWIKIMLAFDVIYATASILVFEKMMTLTRRKE